VTYSIVARDPETGELGVAVQSRAFGTSRVVPWALAGVGAVATQAFGERSYGPLGLELMAAGASPEDALAGLLEADERRDSRQVASLAAVGRGAIHTGATCIPKAGHLAGDCVLAQGNMLASRRLARDGRGIRRRFGDARRATPRRARRRRGSGAEIFEAGRLRVSLSYRAKAQASRGTTSAEGVVDRLA
jgi:hypothetical protein